MVHRHKRQRLSEGGEEAVVSAASNSPEKQASAQEDAPLDHAKNQKHRRSLFVRSLAATTTTEDLTELFSQSYPIKHATAVLDPTTKQCKGYGFVTFADVEDAQRAMEEFNGSTLQGRKIKVEIAEPRHREVDDESGIPGHKKSLPTGAAAEAKAAREKEKIEARQPPRMIVRNLPWSIKEPEQLAVLFRGFGKVKDVKIPTKKPGLLAGFGFVTMRGRKNAEKAMEAINGKEVDGRQLAVDWAVDKDTWQKVQSTVKEEEDEAIKAGDGNESDGGVALDEEDSDVAPEEGHEVELDSDAASDDDEDEDDIEDDWEDEEEEEAPRKSNNESTLFIRNLPFTCTDEQLEEHFNQFGGVRYARIVIDHATERPRGTGFVCFFSKDDADSCVKGAPKPALPQHTKGSKKEVSGPLVPHSVLQNVDDDPEGRYTMDGRVLHVSRAVDRNEAARLTEEGVANRFARDTDKRRLYLLSEGTIASNSPLYEKLSPSEITMREASAKQRKMLIQSNPSLHLSLTRLSIRNIPRSITSKDLKQLAREAVVGFATDVKEGKRQPLSKEELARGGEEMKQAEKERRAKGKGVVKQAKVVFETKEGSKVDERSGAGRSRGYGFIEYYTHRSALMGLRWLNGHAVGYRTQETTKKSKKPSAEEIQDKKKRLIVEFAIENAQVVHRRIEREVKSKEKPKPGDASASEQKPKGNRGRPGAFNKGKPRGDQADRKRKRDAEDNETSSQAPARGSGAAKDEKLAKRQQIIARKRMMRRTRKKGAAA